MHFLQRAPRPSRGRNRLLFNLFVGVIGFGLTCSASRITAQNVTPAAADIAVPPASSVPVIHRTGPVVIMRGLPFSYHLRASNSPTKFGAVGLPPGITCDSATGVVSGVTSASGTFAVTLQATNANGVGTVTEIIPADGITPIEMPYVHRIMPLSRVVYHVGDTFEIALELDAPYEGIVVTGTPRIALTFGEQTRYASYAYMEGEGARPRLHFTYLIVAADAAPGGITVGSSIVLSGGTIRDRRGLFCALGLPEVVTSTVRVVSEASRTSTRASATGD